MNGTVHMKRKGSMNFRGENFTGGVTDLLCGKLKLYGVGNMVFKYAKKNLQTESCGNYDGEKRCDLMKKQIETEKKKNDRLSNEDLHLRVISHKRPQMIRVSVKELEKKKKSYKEAFKILGKYRNLNKESLEGEKLFLIFYISGMIHVHLQNYKKAARSFIRSKDVLDRGQKGGESWTEDFLKGEASANLRKRITKNVLKSEVKNRETKVFSLEGQYGEKVGFIEDFLGESVLIHNGLEKGLEREKVKELFKGMKTCEFNEKILEYLACSMMEERSRTHVIFAEHEIEMDKDCEGYYNNKNTIRIFIVSHESDEIRTDASIKESILHEIFHWGMQRLFNSDTRLYRYGDKEAIKAHNDAVKSVLWNIATAVMSLEDLKKLRKENIIRTENERREIFLEDVFSEDMDAESLAKNVMKLGCLVGKRIKTILVKSSESKFFLKFEPKEVEVVEEEKLKKVFEYIDTVFNGYAFDNRDAEFITSVFVPVTLTVGFREGLLGRIFKPYMEYLEEYVMGQLEKAVKTHPKYELLER